MVLTTFLAFSVLISYSYSFRVSSRKYDVCRRSSIVEMSTSTTPTTATSSIMEDYAGNVMNTYGRYPLAIQSGNGVILKDLEGKIYLDFAAGIATCCLGHAHPALKKAIIDQMDKVNHCSNLYYIPEQAALAKWLVKNSCGDKAFFCNSGAEANEGAIKLARKYAHTKLGIDFPVIITAVNSFHGRTLTAITATGQAKYQKNFGPLTPGFKYCEYNNLEQLKEMVVEIQRDKEELGAGLAAIMMESLQGEGGIKPGDLEFFQGIRKICDETGAVMIMDEVQTGMGRTGKMWGYQNLGIEPDVFTSAKALGGGVPIGAMLCKEKFNVFGPGDHASTYGGNPLACAAGLAVASTFDNEDILGNVEKRGEQLRSRARSVQSKYPQLISDVRGWGLISGIELSEKCPFNAAEVTKKLMNAGVLVVPAGLKVIRFVPPLIVSESEVNKAMDLFEVAVKELVEEALVLA
eukprot:gene11822-15821_t